MTVERKLPDSSHTPTGGPVIPKLLDRPESYDPQEPWASDKLQRKDYAATLTQFIAGIEKPYVLAINAGWGFGKSMFLRMWRDDLVHTQERPCILFNAWESDFGDDPLVALMGTICEFADDQKTKLNKTKRQRLGSMVSAIESTATTLWKNKWSIASEVVQSKCHIDPERALSKPETGRINAYIKQKQILHTFRIQLEELAKELSTPDFPLLIMVDELDRCRPDYAVLVLERIKHLFSVPSVVFVLALEDKSLSHAIKALYGLELEAAGRYLRRFVDMEYRLPEPDRAIFAQYLWAEFNLAGEDVPEEFAKVGITIFEHFSKQFEMGLRDMAQVAALTAAGARAYQANPAEIYLLVFMLILRRECPLNYEQMRKVVLKSGEAFAKVAYGEIKSQGGNGFTKPRKIFAMDGNEQINLEVGLNRIGSSSFDVEIMKPPRPESGPQSGRPW
ncbi:MAG: KAP family NTPase [Proteobacteria bacterium]|nr:KAP family NTPase [Pseudomonadota bacterium]